MVEGQSDHQVFKQDWESSQRVTWNALCSSGVLTQGEGRDKGYHTRRILETPPPHKQAKV